MSWYKRWRTRVLISKLEPFSSFGWSHKAEEGCNKYFPYMLDYLEDIQWQHKALGAIYSAIEGNPQRATPEVASLVLHCLETNPYAASSVLEVLIRKNPAIANETVANGILEHITNKHLSNLVVYALVKANPELAHPKMVEALLEVAKFSNWKPAIVELIKANPKLAAMVREAGYTVLSDDVVSSRVAAEREKSLKSLSTSKVFRYDSRSEHEPDKNMRTSGRSGKCEKCGRIVSLATSVEYTLIDFGGGNYYPYCCPGCNLIPDATGRRSHYIGRLLGSDGSAIVDMTANLASPSEWS